MNAPRLDFLLKNAQIEPECANKFFCEKLHNIFNEMVSLEAQGDDELRSVWIVVERGDINDFGSFEDFRDEGIVETAEQFTELWLSEYPDETRWYKFSVTKYQNELFFFIDSKLTFHVLKDKLRSEKTSDQNEIIDWLLDAVKKTIHAIGQNPAAYNIFVGENLPYNKRSGRILRKDYWSVFPDEKESFEKKLPGDSIGILEKIVLQSKMEKDALSIPTMTAGDFYKYCELGYDANAYFDRAPKKLSPKEKYLAMADGRDCGLRNIDENSAAAFDKWYDKESHCGGHPWEICRGGNSTHISLFVHKSDLGWHLRLAGSSRIRVAETINIAIALYKNKVQFIMEKAEEILQMVNGSDYIGIVPDTVFPQYCHGLFPPDDKIIDFMNLGSENTPEIIKLSYWYPVAEVSLKKNTNV